MIIIPKLFHPKKIFHFIDKRQRFAIQTVILTAGLFITQLIWEEIRFSMVIILSILSYLLTIWSLVEDIQGIKWMMLFILPVFFTASVSLFYFLLPGRWITRVAIMTIFAIGTYATLLIENIYNVAAIRSVPLIRAAHSIGLLLTLIIIFLFSNIIYSLRLPFGQNFLVMFVIIFILSLQSLWSIKLENKFTKQLLIFSFIISLGIGELSSVLSFWPVGNSSFSLLTTSTYYVLIGTLQQYLMDRLFIKNIREYFFVFIFTFVLILLVTNWG